MVPNFGLCVRFESCLCLRLYDFFEISWINRGNDVDQERAGWSSLVLEVIGEIFSDFFIIFDLSDEIFDGKLVVVRQASPLDFLILES